MKLGDKVVPRYGMYLGRVGTVVRMPSELELLLEFDDGVQLSYSVDEVEQPRFRVKA
jgi:hypothetical protein